MPKQPELARKRSTKRDFPVSNIRRYLEPGPIVLVTSAWKDKVNVMTMGWHTVMEFTPSLVGCVIANSNYSFDLIRRSRECVINLPTIRQIDEVVGIGNCSGQSIDKLAKFDLRTSQADKVKAPLLDNCHANFECRLADARLVNKYNFFIFEVIKAHVAPVPKHPETLHYTGDGEFVVAGKAVSRRSKFRPEYLGTVGQSSRSAASGVYRDDQLPCVLPTKQHR